MDSSDYPAGKSPRRSSELQGPRPTPLKVRKDSYKIRKPPMAPQPQPQPQFRPPIIIYAVSPKVIHTNPSEFMALVQRLTGSSSSSTTTAAAAAATAAAATAAAATTSTNFVASNNPWSTNSNGAISPAARFASIEKTRSSPQGKKPNNTGSEDLEVIEGIDIINHGVERTSNTIPGILSPGPGSLQPIPSAFFSPPSDQNPLGFLHDLSPVLYSTKHHLTDNNFLLPSPSTTFVSPHNLTSPFPSLDLFNNFFDL